MSTEMLEGEGLRERAVKRLKKKSDFRIHLLVYVLFNTLLIVVWAMLSSKFFWPIFPMSIWGIGLVAQAWDAYGEGEVPTESQIRREMDRLSARR